MCSSGLNPAAPNLARISLRSTLYPSGTSLPLHKAAHKGKGKDLLSCAAKLPIDVQLLVDWEGVKVSKCGKTEAHQWA